jgi:hypothetical protein
VHCSTAYTPPPDPNDAPLFEVQPDAFANGKAEQVYARIRAGGLTKEDEVKMLQATGHPNTYNFTKCLAEMLLTERRGAVPLTIVRPSIICCSWRHPMPGWIDSKDALAAFMCLFGMGFLHTMCHRATCPVDAVPVDAVANRLLYAAFAPSAGRKADVIYAAAGRHNSLLSSELLDIGADFYKHRRVFVLFPPYMRYAGEVDDPKVWESNAKDERVLSRMACVTSVIPGLGGFSKQLGRAARGIHKIPIVFSPFTHTAFNFVSAIPLEEYCLHFDKHAYMRLCYAGVHHHLLGGKEDPVEAAGLAKVSAISHGGRDQALTVALRVTDGAQVLQREVLDEVMAEASVSMRASRSAQAKSTRSSRIDEITEGLDEMEITMDPRVRLRDAGRKIALAARVSRKVAPA